MDDYKFEYVKGLQSDSLVLNQEGETISETLVALLIAAIALVMLAGVVSTSSNIVSRSRDKVSSYYSKNEAIVRVGASGNSISLSDGTSVSYNSDGQLKFQDNLNKIDDKTYTVKYYTEDEFSKYPVVAYEYITAAPETTIPEPTDPD